MAFFPANFYNEPSSFTPLFRLLDDFDNYSRQVGGGSARRSGLPHWQPKFDLRETADAYELHGELPGVAKENVNIEFSDPQTMVIRGRAERVYTAGTPPSGYLEGSNGTATITEGGESSKPRQASVEDANENNKPAGSSDAVAHQQQESDKKAPADKAKYWLSERSVGEFSRSFSFPTRVDQEAVAANFKDGILNISVPKAKKHESRRIAIN